MSRVLSLLASFASPIFMVAAVAGWLIEIWPPNPLTLAIAALAVVSGPLLGSLLVATASEAGETPVSATQVTVAAPVMLTPRAAAARAFNSWRASVHPAIERRDRERRASRWLRT